MTYMRSPSLEPLISALFPRPDEYWNLYERGPDTNALVDSVMVNVIQKHQQSLRKGHKLYQLDSLLHGMLTEAPHPAGKRHVAVSLHIAHTKGDAAVLELAKVWMENLFLPMVALSQLLEAETSYQVPGSTSESYARMTSRIVEREQHRCAITNWFDLTYVVALLGAGRQDEIPKGLQCIAKVAHIIPFMLNNYAKKRLNENAAPEEKDAINTWDLLRAWTNLEPSDLATDRINSPANGILMSSSEYYLFGNLILYFDKDAYPESPNKYKVRLILDGMKLSNGATSADVEFQARNGIEPPNPQFLKIHASIVKVVHLSGADRYYNSLESSNPVQLDNENGSALLAGKLSSLAL